MLFIIEEDEDEKRVEGAQSWNSHFISLAC